MEDAARPRIVYVLGAGFSAGLRKGDGPGFPLISQCLQPRYCENPSRREWLAARRAIVAKILDALVRRGLCENLEDLIAFARYKALLANEESPENFSRAIAELKDLGLTDDEVAVFDASPTGGGMAARMRSLVSHWERIDFVASNLLSYAVYTGHWGGPTRGCGSIDGTSFYDGCIGDNSSYPPHARAWAETIAAIAAERRGRISIVTLNWDISIEQLLFRDGHMGVHLVLPRGWTHAALPDAESPGTVKARSPRTLPQQADSETCPHLLKLHGSLNWYAPLEAHRSYRSVPGVVRWQIGYAGAYEDAFDPVPLTIGGREMFLVLGLPGRDKYGTTFLLRHIWESAYEALLLADEVIIIGYSLPRYDQQAIALASAISAHRSGSKHIRVICGDGAAGRQTAKRWAMVLGSGRRFAERVITKHRWSACTDLLLPKTAR
jgi:hypothetical protein